MPDQPLRVLIIGAHPDDADVKAGGTAAKWCSLGHVVRLVSLTNGRAGHQTMHGPRLAQRRRTEAQAAAATIGATYEILDHPDGELDDRLEYREEVIRLIRSFRPDLILTHRSTDYHPDHRFAGLLVQDASYLLTVPAICPDVPHLPACPVILSFSDAFTKPCPFEPHVVVDIDGEFDRLVAMLYCHGSQFFEWLPYNAGYLDQVPAGADARRAWLVDRLRQRIEPMADRYRDLIVQTYGPEHGGRVRLIEAFEVSEYGSPLDLPTRTRLFPFLPNSSQAPAPFTRKDWVDLPSGRE
ncbi:MAG TPA: PIG-L family deacetylase [Isosphaeraceae bacterium]|nr:PIG-L family deacetylase [Isosphaeraceae bacterium]